MDKKHCVYRTNVLVSQTTKRALEASLKKYLNEKLNSGFGPNARVNSI